MFLALPVAAGIVIAQLAGGDLRKLAALRFRRIDLFYLAMGFQVLAFPFPWLPWQTSDGIARALWLLSYGLLVLAAFLNRDVPGVPVIAVGMISNVIAVVANGGHMPVLPSALRAAHKSYHVQYNSAAMSSPRLPWLVDRWAVPRWLHVGNVFSVGDVVIGVGAFMLVWSAMGARPSFTRASRRRGPQPRESFFRRIGSKRCSTDTATECCSSPAASRTGPHSCLTMSTEISTAGIAPLFSSQCVVFLSSGQPTPGP